MAATKFLTHVAGKLVEVTSVDTSAGAGDSGKLPALNTSGVLDLTIVNGVTASAGAGDSGKLAALDAAGKLDTSVMPVGIGADTASIQASETLAAGDLVNIHDVTGAFRIRKADATTQGKEAHGFVLAAVTSGQNGTVYFEGSNTGVTGLTPGVHYLSTTAGLATTTPPSGTGNVVQRVGVSTAATVLNFEAGDPITLA